MRNTEKRKPLTAVRKAEEWERLLDLIDWILTHPHPNCYLRQVDLPGIHTKFIETHRGLLSQLLNLVLPEQAIDSSATGIAGFCQRYGFRDKPERIRFRVLDPKIDPFGIKGRPDISLDVDFLSKLPVRPKRLIITENKINFLAFPDLADAWILFGAGYGFSAWMRVEWLRHCQLFYWGDIDTHGFAALDQLRAYFPSVKSFLMDKETLLAHQSHWGNEPDPCSHILHRLTKTENSLYTELQKNYLGEQIRLEQERISLRFVIKFLLDDASTL
ncbi:MAG: Wadjet anti-phage system protein JetD domain-containing protein [Chthoniobacterales bacterium]